MLLRLRFPCAHAPLTRCAVRLAKPGLLPTLSDRPAGQSWLLASLTQASRAAGAAWHRGVAPLATGTEGQGPATLPICAARLGGWRTLGTMADSCNLVMNCAAHGLATSLEARNQNRKI